LEKLKKHIPKVVCFIHGDKSHGENPDQTSPTKQIHDHDPFLIRAQGHKALGDIGIWWVGAHHNSHGEKQNRAQGATKTRNILSNGNVEP